MTLVAWKLIRAPTVVGASRLRVKRLKHNRLSFCWTPFMVSHWKSKGPSRNPNTDTVLTEGRTCTLNEVEVSCSRLLHTMDTFETAACVNIRIPWRCRKETVYRLCLLLVHKKLFRYVEWTKMSPTWLGHSKGTDIILQYQAKGWVVFFFRIF